LTPEEFKTKQAATGGKWIRDAGTYSLSVTGVEVQGTSRFDSQWINLKFTFENAEGQQFSEFVEVPTTAERSFLYGEKKSLANYNKLERFLKGFGITLDYASAMSTIAELFGDAEQTFIGKTVSLRLGFYGNHIKYMGKSGEDKQYMIVNKGGEPIEPKIFTNFDAAKAYAKENSIKLQDFIKVLEVVPAATSAIAPASAVSDLPF